MSTPSAKTPLLVSLALVVVGLVLGAIGGFMSGSILGGIIAAAGAIPAGYAAWAGMQQETQAGLAGAVGMIMLALGAGGILIILGIIDWIR